MKAQTAAGKGLVESPLWHHTCRLRGVICDGLSTRYTKNLKPMQTLNVDKNNYYSLFSLWIFGQ